MRLATFTRGRDNNFNLIRIIAAFAVLVTHSFAIVKGTSAAEPFRNVLGMTMGAIAVDVFFITSGFLVTASLLRTENIVDFVWARMLRILPAMIVMLLITVLGIGLYFTTHSSNEYLKDRATYVYYVKCVTLIAGVAYDLPGVFEANPFGRAVNGSLWTMPSEVRMYALLALLWVALRFVSRVRARLFKLVVVAFAIASGILVIALHFRGTTDESLVRLFFMFFCGSAFFVLKEQIELHRVAFFAMALITIVALLVDKHVFFVAYVTMLAYMLFYIAYIPAGPIRRYNELGDYSYGVYIYAFPIQQSIAASIPGISVAGMIASSAIVTLTLAALSWHLVERNALGLKQRCVAKTERFLSERRSSRSP